MQQTAEFATSRVMQEESAGNLREAHLEKAMKALSQVTLETGAFIRIFDIREDIEFDPSFSVTKGDILVVTFYPDGTATLQQFRPGKTAAMTESDFVHVDT